MPKATLAGTRIRALRTARGMAQGELARRAGVSPSYLNLIEHNRRRPGTRVTEALAKALQVAPDMLAEAAGDEQIMALQASLAAVQSSPPPEIDRAEELIGRFPGWAAHLAALAARVQAQERLIERLNDRMAHDPSLPAALHEIVSAVTAVQSTAAILADTDDLEPAWRARFHRNVHDDSRRLATAADALVAYLEASGTETGLASPLEELEAWAAARGYHLPQIEAAAPADWDMLVAGESDLASPAARALAAGWLARAHADAQAVPLGMLDPWLECSAGGMSDAQAVIAGIVQRSGAGLACVLRRLACLPPGIGAPAVGLVRCDASGSFTWRRPVEGFSMPRFGGACPLWPLYQVLGMPGRPLGIMVEFPGRPAPRFTVQAVAEVSGGLRFNPPWAMEAVMLMIPQAGGAGQSGDRQSGDRQSGDGQSGDGRAPDPLRVGASCRVCPRSDCHARREPSIVGG